MRRWIYGFILVLSICMGGCASTHTYLFYEVVRKIDHLKVADEVRIVLQNGDTVRGTVLRIRDSTLTVASRKRGERTVAWEDIRVLERIRKARVREY